MPIEFIFFGDEENVLLFRVSCELSVLSVDDEKGIG
jgi:hypothetical protein